MIQEIAQVNVVFILIAFNSKSIIQHESFIWKTVTLTYIDKLA